MKAVFQSIKTYVKTRDVWSWFLATAGFVLIAMEAESFRLHREVGPTGGHHGDVAGGISLLSFLFLMVPLVLAFAGVGALLGKSTDPLIGALLGLIASIPMLLVLGLLSVFLCYVSPFLGIPFPFVVGTFIVVTSMIRKTKNTETCANAPSA